MAFALPRRQSLHHDRVSQVQVEEAIANLRKAGSAMRSLDESPKNPQSQVRSGTTCRFKPLNGSPIKSAASLGEIN